MLFHEEHWDILFSEKISVFKDVQGVIFIGYSHRCIVVSNWVQYFSTKRGLDNIDKSKNHTFFEVYYITGWKSQ